MKKKIVENDLFSENKAKFFTGLNMYFKYHDSPDGSIIIIDDVRESIYESCNNLLVSEYQEGYIPEIQTYINDKWRYDQYRWGAYIMKNIQKCVDIGRISGYSNNKTFDNDQKIFLGKLDKCFDWDIYPSIDGFFINDVKDTVQIGDYQKCKHVAYEIEKYIKENLCVIDSFYWGIQMLECIMN